jgi:acyl-CoA synthetase (NDP forming)
VSGGFGVMMADAAATIGVELPQMPAEAQAKIKASLAFAAPANPVDVTPQLLNDFSLVRPVLAAMLEGDNFDSLVGFFGTMGLDRRLIGPLKDSIREARVNFPGRFIALCMMSTPETRAELEAEGIPVFDDPNRIVTAIARLADVGAALSCGPAGFHGTIAPAASVAGAVSEHAAKALLAQSGLAFADERLVEDGAAAGEAAVHFGLPVALKVASPDIAHKSDVGGVALDVSGAEKAAEAFARIVANARKAVPLACIDGVLVSPMVTGGVETVIGSVNDPDFGPLVMFGLGGIHVETLKDVTFRLAPVTEDEALAMVREIRGFPVLQGTRGAPPSDLGALARSIAALSRFAAAHAADVASVEINPFIALPQGGLAVDALILPVQETKA